MSDGRCAVGSAGHGAPTTLLPHPFLLLGFKGPTKCQKCFFQKASALQRQHPHTCCCVDFTTSWPYWQSTMRNLCSCHHVFLQPLLMGHMQHNCWQLQSVGGESPVPATTHTPAVVCLSRAVVWSFVQLQPLHDIL